MQRRPRMQQSADGRDGRHSEQVPPEQEPEPDLDPESSQEPKPETEVGNGYRAPEIELAPERNLSAR